MQVEVLGIPGLREAFSRVRSSLYESEVQALFLGVARKVSSRAKELAPVGNHPTYSQLSSRYVKQPGRLRRSIVAQAFNLAVVRKYGPGAYAQVNLSRQRNAAPYAHLPEGGRGDMRPRRKKVLAWMNRGGMKFAKRVRGFAGRRYWQRAYESVSASTLQTLAADVARIIEQRYSR